MTRTLKITHNPSQLTEEERKELKSSTTFMLIYGSGMIYIDGCRICWDCTNIVAAKEYLESLGAKQEMLQL